MDVKIIPGRLCGTLDAPPSKSHAHRVLIAYRIAQLQGNTDPAGNGASEAYDIDSVVPSFSQDIEATKSCLVQMDKSKPYLDCRESGSTLRFMLPVAMALKDEAVFLGSGKLPHRPISSLKEEMEANGCSFHMNNKDQRPGNKCVEICTINGRLLPGTYKLSGSISSQFITGLLLALPILDGDSRLELTTELQSAGYVDLTLDVLRDFGINIKCGESDEGFPAYEIAGNQQFIPPEKISIQCDWSNSAFWLACGALGSDITLKGLDFSSSQRDKEIARLLESMGAVLESTDTPGMNHIPDSIGEKAIRCTGDNLNGTEVNVSQIPDLVPVLAAVMSLSKGSSMITHAERLRIKESDRLFTVFDFLSRLGADITDGGASLSITGQQQLSGGEISGHNDHRIVMAAAVASCGCSSPVIIRGAEAVNKSYPTFFNDFAALGGEVYEV